jgi:NAD(P)-dependent dehydrogenase (short-subunit alcohol dehydrogenase family)
MSEREVAVVVGVGPGLGAALVARLLGEGLSVVAVARDARRLQATLAEQGLSQARALAADAVDAAAIAALFTQVERELGPPSLVIFNAGTYEPAGILELTPAQLERSWRVGCLGGFIVGQAAARAMLPRGRGTVLFSGATASVRGSARFAALAVPKFGLRALPRAWRASWDPRGCTSRTSSSTAPSARATTTAGSHPRPSPTPTGTCTASSAVPGRRSWIYVPSRSASEARAAPRPFGDLALDH